MHIIKNTILGLSIAMLSTSSLAVVVKKDYQSEENRRRQQNSTQISAKGIQHPDDATENMSDDDLASLNEQLEAMAASKGTPKRHKKKTLKEKKRDDAFNLMLDNLIPLTPDEVHKVRKLLDESKKAAATPANPPPTPNFSTTLVNLEPGSFPPVIRLSAGFVSSLLFIDSTGAPWPIAAYSLGDAQTFNIQWDQKSNTLFIQSLKEYAHTNMAIQLAGLNTPVMLTLVSGQKNVDFRIDMQVSGRGPNAKPIISSDALYTSPQVDTTLMNILDGVPPKNSSLLTVAGGYGDAWLAGNRLYLRTKLTLLSPAWTSSITSPDGTKVYEMMPTSHLLASGDGRTFEIKITGM